MEKIFKQIKYSKLFFLHLPSGASETPASSLWSTDSTCQRKKGSLYRISPQAFLSLSPRVTISLFSCNTNKRRSDLIFGQTPFHPPNDCRSLRNLRLLPVIHRLHLPKNGKSHHEPYIYLFSSPSFPSLFPRVSISFSCNTNKTVLIVRHSNIRSYRIRKILKIEYPVSFRWAFGSK